LFHAIATSVLMITRDLEHVPDEFQGLERMLCDTYFCNCSIFQSLPDAWAIDQLFPIMPIHRLDEPPQRRAILADVTCDSDGRIDRFIGPPDVPEGLPVLPLHDLPGAGTEAEPYLLGVFLVGAYQETLGDLHNLFGDTNAVHIALDEQGQPAIDEVIEGDTVRDVLQYVQWDPGQLRRRFRLTVEAAVRDGGLSVAQARRLSEFYEQGLRGYTYLT
jgi:arginine decarboxylase